MSFPIQHCFTLSGTGRVVRNWWAIRKCFFTICGCKCSVYGFNAKFCSYNNLATAQTWCTHWMHHESALVVLFISKHCVGWFLISHFVLFFSLWSQMCLTSSRNMTYIMQFVKRYVSVPYYVKMLLITGMLNCCSQSASASGYWKLLLSAKTEKRERQHCFFIIPNFHIMIIVCTSDDSMNLLLSICRLSNWWW